MPITTHPLTPDRWPDLVTVFEARGCSVARGCWCMYYRCSGQLPAPAPGQTQAQARRAAFKAIVDSGRFTGLLAYRDGVPVGWLSFGPREDFAKLQRSPVMKPVDTQPVWSVICFVVPAAYRGQGVATALLKAAVRHARKAGVQWLEGYPVDKGRRSDDDAMWFGAKSMFDAAGFDEVARRKPARPIVRLRPA
jgi:GNAT superfamily N-acetyltransferase